MYAVKEVVADDFAGNGLGFRHPAPRGRCPSAPGGWTQQARHAEHGGGDLVGDDFRWVEVAGIRAQRGLAAGGITHVELV